MHRVEDLILGQLEDLALEFKREKDEVTQRLKRIERSLMSEKLKAAATKALSSGLATAGLKAGQKKSSRMKLIKTPQPASAWPPGEREDDATGSSETHGDSKPP